MPERADPNSDEAQMIGQLSKRRQYNIHWRYYRDEIRKVRAPIIIQREEPASKHGDASELPLSIISDIVSLSKPRVGITHSSRWLRRRYADLLARLPLLTAKVAVVGADKQHRVQHVVGQHPAALRNAMRGTRRSTVADVDSATWTQAPKRR